MAIRVLIADDEEAHRRKLRATLESQPDIEVIDDVRDGEAALRVARDKWPDVALADIRMRGMDALEFTRQLAGPRVRKPVRVVMLTTFALDWYVYNALREGACGFLLKPTRPKPAVEGVRVAAAGATLVSPKLAVRLLRQMSTRAAIARGDERVDGELLNEWEIDIAQLVAQGRTDAEIGDELYISPISVQRRIVEIAHKLGVRSRIAIALWAWEAGHVRRW
ncbi:response regulator [Fodinicola acaciae]|uniref:response regulator n=1 Tax=Fodinicola acaciae TaxID=2681555 RepID=UPI0013D6A9AB|nr:response regulator transcription factor [Fodinicola acaciae]